MENINSDLIRDTEKSPSSSSFLLTTVRFLTSIKRNVPAYHAFVLSSGIRIHNLKQLAIELDNMPDEVFNYHVNESKNDFYNWIKDVMRDDELSSMIQNITNKKDMQICILKYIVKRI